jgi:hypothetical protein
MIDNVVTFPGTHLRHFRSSLHEVELINRVKTLAKRRTPLTQHLIGRLSWHPSLVGHAMMTDDIGYDVQQALFSDPYVAYLTMMHKYAILGPRLEETFVRTSPAAVALLLKSHRANPKRLLLSEAEYLAILAENDPARRLWFASGDEVKDLIAGFMKDPQFAAPQTAPWAYLRLALTATKTIPQELAAIIAKDEEFIFRTATLMRHRAKAAADMDGALALLQGVKSPRWIFHLLRDNLVPAGELRDAMFKALKACPAWFIELMVLPIWGEKGELHGGTEKLSAAVLENLYLDLISFGHNHPSMDDAHYWARQVMMPEPVKLLTILSESLQATAA